MRLASKNFFKVLSTGLFLVSYIVSIYSLNNKLGSTVTGVTVSPDTHAGFPTTMTFKVAAVTLTILLFLWMMKPVIQKLGLLVAFGIAMGLVFVGFIISFMIAFQF